MALNLVIAAIVFRNTLYMEKAAAHLDHQGQIVDPNLLSHTSPLWLGADYLDRRLRLAFRKF